MALLHLVPISPCRGAATPCQVLPPEPDESAESLRLERILAHAHPEQPLPEGSGRPEDVPVALTEQQIEEMMKRTLRKLLFSEEPPPPSRGGRR